MNSTQINNARHQDCLDKVKAFEKSGGKIKKPPGNYEGQVYEFPRPKHRQKKSNA